jgi:hypothetical protein
LTARTVQLRRRTLSATGASGPLLKKREKWRTPIYYGSRFGEVAHLPPVRSETLVAYPGSFELIWIASVRISLLAIWQSLTGNAGEHVCVHIPHPQEPLVLKLEDKIEKIKTENIMQPGKDHKNTKGADQIRAALQSTAIISYYYDIPAVLIALFRVYIQYLTGAV